MKQALILIVLLLCLNQVSSQKNNNEYCIINDTTNIYRSIDKILELSEFKNKVVYIDIWDTGCKFCIAEFKYAAKLKEHFKNDSIEFLYLCARHYDTRKKDTRNIKNEKLWKELILKNKLKGTHVLMSNDCYIEGYINKYENEYPGNIHWGVPQYLLVNKQGEIVNFLAPRPSMQEAVCVQIQKLLDEN
ncbi:hypothetical protein DMA11_08640 [Marinilabiliaceae bacterium JC017]|nr:hypothetical protein DMA11_08640 [Marinilabiliaceae bacterium JC017]